MKVKVYILAAKNKDNPQDMWSYVSSDPDWRNHFYDGAPIFGEYFLWEIGKIFEKMSMDGHKVKYEERLIDVTI